MIGVEILFGTTKMLEIRYHSSSHVPVYTFNGNTWDHAAANRYLGTIAEADVGSGTPAGYTSFNADIATTTLLANYFNNDDTQDNLQIIDDADLPGFGADVFISERRRNDDGVFATISATDDDGTAPNNEVSYDITGGTGETLFEIDDNGGISVASGRGFNSESTLNTYTLTIEASDGATPAMKTPTTITIGVEVDFT